MKVMDKSLEKKLEEWYQRGLELERRGIAPGVTGAAGSAKRLQARTGTGQFYRDLEVRAGRHKLKIAVVEQAKAEGGHAALAVLLDLSVTAKGRGKGSGKKAIATLESFVRDSVAEWMKRQADRGRRPSQSTRPAKLA